VMRSFSFDVVRALARKDEGRVQESIDTPGRLQYHRRQI
jgi:hypothetical protein